MKLAPRMIQSMEILQMPSLELEARIEQELASNPTLELREASADPEDVASELTQEERDAREGERELVVSDDPSSSDNKDDFERLTNLSEEIGDSWESNNYETGESFRKRSDTGERDGKLDAMANTAARPASLTDQLLDQWRMVEKDSDTARLGDFLIGFIDEDGYLRTEVDTLLKQAPPGTTEAEIARVVSLLQQSLEPVGMAARDVRECLLLQIDTKASQNGRDFAHERILVDKHLEDIGNNRLPKVAKSTGLTLDEIKAAMKGLRQFYFHPGRLIVEDHSQTITPDAIIEFDEEEDRYIAILCNGRYPGLQISPSYLEMLADKAVEKKTRDFIGNNVRSARWLIDAIAQRDQTLLRVIHVVLQAQRDYFDQGAQAMHPLPMTQVADQLGIHVATVSRAVNEKYLQTPRGIVPLRMFFSGGTETEDGEAMSWTAIQAKLEQIIDEEDKAKPLNDDELVEKLKEHGIEIARRTVAKYRKQLGIPAARQRREY